MYRFRKQKKQKRKRKYTFFRQIKLSIALAEGTIFHSNILNRINTVNLI